MTLRKWQRWTPGLVSVALLVATLSTGAATPVSAHAQESGLYYVRGHRVEGSWLCYGWFNGTFRCTQHWYVASDGRYISLNPRFVPSQKTPPPTPPKPAPSPKPCQLTWAHGIPLNYCVGIQRPARLGLWVAPPAPFNKIYYVAASQWSAKNGWPTCTWWAYETGPSIHGVRHPAPKVGATIWYNPGVLGASSDGHYGHVVAIYSNGWILTSEMNFYWRGGGAGRVDFRFIPPHTAGVSFIY